MTDRVDELGERARWFLEQFDEIDLADICASEEAAKLKAQAAIDRVRQLAAAQQAEGVDGVPCDADTLWPSEVLAALAGPANNGEQRPRTTPDNSPTSSDTEADLSRVIALYERWLKAGAPPLGVSINRWWDRRLIELRHAIVVEPASDAGPSVAECVKADRAWDVQKGGE